MESNTSALALKRTSVVGDSAVHREATEGPNREGHEGSLAARRILSVDEHTTRWCVEP
jgi:hypothetical protein